MLRMWGRTLLLLFLVCAAGVGHAHAATIYSNSATGNDSTGDGSVGNPYATFHKAYTIASANDTLNLSGTFTWTDSGETGDNTTTGYTIGKNLTIIGQGATQTIVQAATASTTGTRRVFTVSSGVTASIQNIEIRHGRVTSGYGGGILNNGNLTVLGSRIDNNTTSDGGSGIDNLNILTIASSTVDHNLANGSASMGAGILSDYYIVSGGYTTITNTTIAYNTLTATTGYYSGAGVHFRKGSGTITNSTISYNESCESALGMDDTLSVLTIKNTIVANNIYHVGPYCSNSTAYVDFAYRQSGYGNVVDNGNNIVGYSNYYTWSGSGDWTDTNRDGTFVLQTVGTTGSLSQSSTLAANDTLIGTQTFAFTSSASIAINNGATGSNGATSTVPTTDQRGGTRNGSTDIGAYEYNAGGITDTTVPVVSISAPSASGSVKGTTSITASATDDVAIAGVTFYVDSVQQGSEDTSSPYALSWDSTAVAEGSHTVFAVARDSSNNSTTASTITFTVDNTVPTVSLTAPTNGAYVTGSSVTLSASASDTNSLAGVKFYINGTLQGSEDTTSPYSITWNTTATTSGTKTIVAVARDAASNYATSSSISVTVDNTAPTASTLSPADNATGVATTANLVITFSENVTATTSKNIVIKKSSDNSTVETIAADDVSKVTVSGATVTIDPATTLAASTGYYVNIDSGAFVDVATTSYAGIANTTSWNFTTVDTGAPTATMTAPADGASVRGTAVTLSASATDDILVSGVKFYINGTLQGSEDTTSPYSITWNTTATTSGAKTIVAVARDSSTNYGTSTPITVTVDNTAPTISNIATTTLTSTGITATWTTNESADSQINYGATSSYGATTTLAASLVTSHSHEITGLSPSTTYHFRIRSSDAAGNLTTSADQTFTTAVADTTAPSVTLTLPTNGASISGSAIGMAATASDDVGVIGVKFYVNGVLVGSEDLTSPYTQTWNSIATSSGTRSVFAVARDGGGNFATSSVATVTLANQPIPTSVAVVAATTTARVTWTTPIAGSSRMFFGLTSAIGSSTPEANTDSKVTDHSLDVTSLPACAVYRYLTVSKNDGEDVATSSESTFKTAGCAGGASILANGESAITAASGGTFTEGLLTLAVPPSFTSTTSTATFQASKLDGSTFFASAGAPTGRTRAGDTVYHLAAIANESTVISTFEEPLSVTLSYADADVAGLDLTTLAIHRYDDTSWNALSSCTVNTTAKTVTCTTTAFSDFAIFGDEATSAHSSLGARPSSVATPVSLPASQLQSRPLFTQILRARGTHAEVKKLQQFLNTHGFIIAATGAGAPGAETNYFGTKTQVALKKFQEAHTKEILTPVGLSKGTGLFGASTRAYINSILNS